MPICHISIKEKIGIQEVLVVHEAVVVVVVVVVVVGIKHSGIR
jgi:hypothetical protein